MLTLKAITYTKRTLINGLSGPQTVDFSVLENILTQNVALRRRATTLGTLLNCTTCVVMANRSPKEMFGVDRV